MVPAGTYRRLVEAGCLIPSDGLRVPPVRMVTDEVAYRWPNARVLVADRFKLGELQDAARARVEPRRTRWSEASEDINAFRRMVKDGPLGVHPGARALLTESLAVSRVRLEEGNTRIEKSKKNRARDDVCAAAVLACGSVDRMLRRPTAVPTWTTYT